MLRLLVGTVCALFLAACGGDDDDPTPGGAAGNGGTPGGTEEPLQTLPTVRQEHAVVAVGVDVYVIGGFAPGPTATVDAYDTETDQWRSVADLPEALQHANAAVVNGKIYVAGYYPGTNFSAVEPKVLEFDPAANAWTNRGTMPAGTQRATACVAELGGKIYLFGGGRGGSTVADASAYDPAANSWEELPSLPEPREHCTAGAIDGKIYIASGRSNGIGGFQPKTYAFDPASREYAEVAPIPTPRGGTAGAVLGNKLFVFGGEGNAAAASRGVFPKVEAYDPATDSWQTYPDMLVPRHGFGAAVVGERIYLPGGATQQAFGAVNNHSVFY
jgi:N-acetylneuraminic acid mutarotase